VSRDPNPPNTQPETRDWRTGEVWNIIEKLLIHNNDVSFHGTKYLAKSTYLHYTLKLSRLNKPTDFKKNKYATLQAGVRKQSLTA
jgi:hypothetical protein